MADQQKLRVDSVTSGYGSGAIVNNVSLSVAPGEIFALLGKNGMGKTTLVKTVLGLVRASQGRITLNGRDVNSFTATQLQASGIGYAPQEQPLFQDLSVRDNLRLGLRHDRNLPAAVERIAEHFPVIATRLAQTAGTLSGGEQKMLILARALMTDPDLLVIDEISEGLQPSIILQIGQALKRLRDERGTTIVLVEQHLEFALSIADRWAVLKLGSIDDQGPNRDGSRERILEHLSL